MTYVQRDGITVADVHVGDALPELAYEVNATTVVALTSYASSGSVSPACTSANVMPSRCT